MRKKLFPKWRLRFDGLEHLDLVLSDVILVLGKFMN
jgi:hypothetical protein